MLSMPRGQLAKLFFQFRINCLFYAHCIFLMQCEPAFVTEAVTANLIYSPAAVSSSNQTYLQELKDKELSIKEEVDSRQIRLEAFSVRNTTA